MDKNTTIILYQLENCPFCAKVREKLEEKGLAYKKVNVNKDREDPIRIDIAKNSGVLTVPVINKTENGSVNLMKLYLI